MPATFTGHDASRIRNLIMSDLHRYAAAERCEVPDLLVLLVTTSHTTVSGAHSPFTRLESTTPSQPAEPSHASAAQTNGGVLPPASPSVDPEQPGKADEQPETHGSSPCIAAREADRPATYGQLVTGGESAAPSTGQSGEETSSSPAPGTQRAAILACIDDNTELPSKLIAQMTGATEDLVRATASKFQRKLVTWWDYQRWQKAKTTDALKAAQAPVETLAEPQFHPPAELPPTASPLPPVEADATDVLHRPRRPSSTRFRLREKLGQGLYLHMSGQKLTDQKTYAWSGTEKQLLAARQAFPAAAELAEEVVVK